MISWLYCWHTGRTSMKVCRDGGISSVPGRIVARIDLTRSRRRDATINSTSTCARPHILWVRTTLGFFISFVHTHCAFFIKTFHWFGVLGSIYGSSCGISGGQICAGTGFCLSISVLPRHLPFYQWPYSYARFVVYILRADVKQTTRKTAKPQDLKWDEISSVSLLSTSQYFLGTRQTGNLN